MDEQGYRFATTLLGKEIGRLKERGEVTRPEGELTWLGAAPMPQRLGPDSVPISGGSST